MADIFEISIPVGDWSADGHGRCEEVDFISNYPVEDLRAAYHQSVKKTDIAFHHRGAATTLCTEWEQTTIPAEVMERFKKLGYKMPEDVECGEGDAFYSIERFGSLILWFIGLSMPDDWEYTVKEKIKKTYLNGYWCEELNEQFGYGLFY